MRNPLKRTESRRDGFVGLRERICHRNHSQPGRKRLGLGAQQQKMEGGGGVGRGVRGRKNTGMWCDQKEGGAFLASQMGFLDPGDS